MMKKLARGLFVALIAGFVALPGYAADLKIGFVDGTKIVQKYQPEIDEKLQKEFKGRETKIIALQDELKKIDEKLRRDNATLSEAELKNLQKDFQTKEAEFQRQGTAFSADLNKRGNEELQILVKQVQAVVDATAKSGKYDIILQRGAAVYLDEQYNLTDAVMKELDAKVKL